MPLDDEDRIGASWETNTGARTDAERGGRIGSRTRVTDAAIVDAVLACGPRTVLDVGCGEGWRRLLVDHGLRVIDMHAPVDPADVRVASLILRAGVAGPP